MSVQTRSSGMRSVVVTLGPPLTEPWWWKEIKEDPDLCALSFHRVNFNHKTSRQVRAIELPVFLLRMLPVYIRLRRDFQYIFTFECDLTTFALAFWQTLFRHSTPRHVVLQFIMREKTAAWSSRLKYAAMRWCFSSLYRVVCSASGEADYYRTVFNWPKAKAAFVPFHTSGRLVAADCPSEDGFILSAGRTFRDFPTLLAAIRGTAHRTVIVAAPNAVKPSEDADNVQVLEELPPAEFDAWIRRASIVVVPLQDTRLSAGQLVILHAMALAKPVIATRTVATIDYIVDGANGMLVEPNDPHALREAIDLLMSNATLRRALGDKARQTIMCRHLPHHYTRLVRAVL